jgi:hypothetical protein
MLPWLSARNCLTTPEARSLNSAETIAAGVIQANELPTPLVWIEYWPEESTEGQESFELVVFSSYEVVESALSRRDESVDRGRNVEESGPRYGGGLGK